MSAVATLEAKRLTRVIDRGLKSNAYIVNWEPIFSAYQEMKRFEKRNALRNAEDAEQKVASHASTVAPEVAAHVLPEVASKPIKGTSELKEPMTLSEPSSDGSYLVDIKKVEEALQGEQEASPSLPPEGLTYEDACNNVSLYCQPFHWDHITEADYEAAVSAEQMETGAGRAVVNGAATRAWQAKLKGANHA